MRLVLASLAATVFLATGAQAQDAPRPRPVVGGFSAIEVDAEVTKAAEFALGELQIPVEDLDHIEQAKRQVVAGTNYNFVMVLKDGRKFRVQVWAKLDRSYALTSSEEIHAH
ncbi:cystatin domain-containing protein [Sphingomonas sp. AOB5]|uniref:cystatin domain-containing protein n=1 Tax=Sphingomonas sp. AOB5 TaxID=3034017 RepID=UPI0023F85B31|nr:cystatin domain-containing protein [Sphingomonas sp. AOB5]MDF7773935.1 cystatin domain-containing protein [Sphingomonas sp. AOB5]